MHWLSADMEQCFLHICAILVSASCNIVKPVAMSCFAICCAFGKDTASEMQKHLGRTMKQLSDFSRGVDLVVTETWTILLFIEPHLTADHLALFVWRKGNTVTSLQRCYKCAPCPSSCCCDLPLLDVHYFIYTPFILRTCIQTAASIF